MSTAAHPRGRTTTARSRHVRGNGWFWVFVGPFLLGLLVFVYIPVLWSLFLSFFEARNTVTPTHFVGFSNYAYLLSDAQFRRSLLTFIVFAALIVPLTYVCSLGLALLLYRMPRFQAFFRSVFFLPTAVSYVIAAMIWRLEIFSGARFGLINTLLTAGGGNIVNWLGGASPVYWIALVSLRLWLQVGFYMILIIAGLNRIPASTYEAAALDGATGWRTLRYVTLPQLRATTVAVLMLLLINAFQAFDEFYNLLSSGNSVSGVSGYPPFARPPLVHLYLISLGGGSQDLGLGSAGTMIVTAVIALLGLLQTFVLRRTDPERSDARPAIESAPKQVNA